MDLSDRSYEHLLLSNDPPCPEEQVVARRAAVFMARIVADLQSQLDLAKFKLNQYQTILCPWRRVPLEVTGEIFKFVFPSVTSRSDMKALVELCLVCKSWRDAARLVPQLWSSLEIDIRTHHHPSYEGIFAWLNRSGRIPKSVTLQSTKHECIEFDSCQLANPVFAKLLTEGPPLESLSLVCSSSNTGCIKYFLQRLDYQPNRTRAWDTIKSFSLDLRNDVDHTLILLESFNTSFLEHILPPLVTSLCLRLPSRIVFDSDADTEDAQFPFPRSALERLTSFHFDCDWDGIHIFTILQYCPNLETLILGFNGRYLLYSGDPPLMDTVISSGMPLPNLHTLRLEDTSPTLYGVDPLEQLRAPGLLNLDINFKFFNLRNDNFVVSGNSHIGARLPFFLETQAKCGLTARTLRLHRLLAGESNELARILIHFPSLTHLTLENVVFNEDVFLEIERMGCFPQLQVLDLLELPLSFNFSYVNDFVARRNIRLRTTYGQWLNYPWIV